MHVKDWDTAFPTNISDCTGIVIKHNEAGSATRSGGKEEEGGIALGSSTDTVDIVVNRLFVVGFGVSPTLVVVADPQRDQVGRGAGKVAGNPGPAVG